MIMYNLTSDKFATLTSVKKVQNMNRTTSSDILTVVLCREWNTLKTKLYIKILMHAIQSLGSLSKFQSELYHSLISLLYLKTK